MSPRKGMTHKENFEYTMNRLQHITEQGYKVMYIWIMDFKRYTLDLEESENNDTPRPNLFDYMNVNKRYKEKDNKQQDVKLLYNGSQRHKGITRNNHSFQRNAIYVHDNITNVLDNAFKKKDE